MFIATILYMHRGFIATWYLLTIDPRPEFLRDTWCSGGIMDYVTVILSKARADDWLDEIGSYGCLLVKRR